MYRSQKHAKFVNGKKFQARHPEVFPICIPSYNRPEPKILEGVDDSLPLVFFVRKEQLEDYKYLRERFRVVPITGVSDIGETRAKIVKWAKKKGYSDIFMLDDDITSLDYLYPGETRGGNTCMRASKLNQGKPLKGLNPTAFRIWMYWLDKLDDEFLVASAPLYRPDSWHMKNADAPMRYNSGIVSQCIHLNIDKLCELGIQYESNAEEGVEDYALQFKIMNAGYKTVVLTDLVYDCPPINSCAGGCEGMNGYSDAAKRYEFFHKQFLKNVCGRDHPGIVTKTSRSGFKTIKFNWKYWRDQLEES